MITEYELYSDEREHRNASGKHLLLGGIVCTDNGRKRLQEETEGWNRLAAAMGSVLAAQPEEI